ncbi:MAG TPA: LON peptidase substrate-binding domain-containing protein, partial [Acidimicrobiales bacterium]|nr:LON peptidase substrate-binding domain-containing protein [Acidimicrobiales bacterium]
RFDDGRWTLVVRGTRRIEVVTWLEEVPYPLAEVRDRPDEPADVDTAVLDRAQAAVRRVRTLASELGRAPALDDRELGEPMALWALCDATPLTAFDRQRLLQAPDASARAAALTELARALGDDLAALL